MKKVQFIFGIHNHQPVGNFDHVFEEAYQKSYRPFIDVLERHPDIAMAMHFSGCLLDWLEQHHPDYIERVARLVQRGNIEIMAAGYYEPILAIIPDHDKIGQINKLREYISDRFGYQSHGAWLTERVWEPHLAKPINMAGIDYITVDDYHFLASGKDLEELNGYFNTDEQGHTVGVFPISQRLRYAMPFKEPKATVDILREYATEAGDNVIVMADDGEKFGLWPGTNESCYGQGQWLERFFQTLEANSDWLVTTTFNDYTRRHPPRGLVFLPTISYFEMSEWTLPARQGQSFAGLVKRFGSNGTMDKVRPFLRGGTWRNFQSIYSESNWMQKRMLEASYRLAELESGQTSGLEVARKYLWQAQCNCAYWHGIFGGLYLPHLRHAIFENLLQAEQILDRITGPVTAGRDIDRDGSLEYNLQSDELKIIASAAGGTIKELDFLPRNFNLLNTMRRYRESYHTKITEAGPSDGGGSIHDSVKVKEEGLSDLLFADQWPRRLLQDHFLTGGQTATGVRQAVDEIATLMAARFEVAAENGLILTGRGMVNDTEVIISKHLQLEGDSLTINLTITNSGGQALACDYASELNFSLLGGHTPDRYYSAGDGNQQWLLDADLDLADLSEIFIFNEWDHFRIIIDFPGRTDLWCYPVETVSMSEAGFEKVYQSSVIMPHWGINLSPGQAARKTIHITVKSID